MNKLSFLALAALMAGCCCNTDDMKPFGTTKFGEKASLYTLKSPDGLTLEITDFGGRLVRCWAPDREGKLADVTLGWNTVGEYETLGFSMGTLIGRYGNRIANGKFMLDGKEFRGHEFHYTQFLGEVPPSACQVYNAKGEPVDTPIIRYKNVLASYTHIYRIE